MVTKSIKMTRFKVLCRSRQTREVFTQEAVVPRVFRYQKAIPAFLADLLGVEILSIDGMDIFKKTYQMSEDDFIKYGKEVRKEN